MTDCEHIHTNIVVIARQCEDCKKVFQDRVRGNLEKAIEHVRQGRMSVKEATYVFLLPENESEYLNKIPVCKHENAEPCTCGGKNKWRCILCRRKFEEYEWQLQVQALQQ